MHVTTLRPRNCTSVQRTRRNINAGSHHVATVCHGSKRGDVLLIADTVGKSFDGDKTLFSGLTFSVVSGDRLAIVGPNGTGKSTLLKVISGSEVPDQGTITRNKGAKVGYLAQDPDFDPDMTVLQVLLQGDSAMSRAVQQYQKALVTAGGGITRELERAIEQMDALNAWEVDAEARRVLEVVGMKDPSVKVGQLSGGQQKRVALAAALLGNPDLLVLDEPTNHMDVSIIQWMEEELTKREDLALALVTHDRLFMEGVCNRILELDRGKCFTHDFGGDGSYQAFKEAREFRRKAQQNAAADARTLFKREAEWMSRQPKARQAKSSARIKKFYELSSRAADVPEADLKVDFGGMKMMRQGNKLIKMTKVGYKYSGKGKSPGPDEDVPHLIRDFTFQFFPGDRLGIAGPNGVGKSTLMDMVAGTLAPTEGIREMGETALVGYLTQHPPAIRPDLRVLDYIKEVVDDRKARGAGLEAGDTPEVLLERLGFARPRQYQKVESLSGGELRRLHLASVLLARPNVLLMDEPTNDLDLQTVEVVEQLLAQYKGVLLVVSHDRAFMDNVTNRLLVLKGDGLVRLFEGTYSEYLEMLEEEKGAAQPPPPSQRSQASGLSPAGPGPGSQATSGGGKEREAAPTHNEVQKAPSGSSSTSTTSTTQTVTEVKKRRLGYYEQVEYKKLTQEIDGLSAKRDQLNEQVLALAQSGSDYAKLEELTTTMGQLQDEIDLKSERWLELAEIAGDI